MFRSVTICVKHASEICRKGSSRCSDHILLSVIEDFGCELVKLSLLKKFRKKT